MKVEKQITTSDFYEGMHITRWVHEFQDCLLEVGLTDMMSHGALYAWTNKRVDGFFAKKLDRVLINDEWFQSFPDMKTEFLSPDFSDHAAGWIRTGASAIKKAKPFKYLNFLAKQ